MTTIFKEGYFTGEFLFRELYGVSRGTVTFDNTGVALDTVVQAGTVFAFEAPGNVVAATAGNTGNGTVTNVQANLVAEQLGTYVVTLTGPTSYTVTEPDGTVLPAGTVGQGFLDSIGFQLNAGGTPFVAGDAFNVVIANGAAPAVSAKAGGNTGNGTLTNVEAVQQAFASPGNYLITFTAPTVFTVVDPRGVQLAAGAVGKYYEDRLGFLITAGGTAFVAGDSFTIGINTGNGLVTAYNGTSPAAGIIYNTDLVPANGTLVMTSVVRFAEVQASALIWNIGVTAAEQQTAISQLLTLGIVAR